MIIDLAKTNVVLFISYLNTLVFANEADIR